jgi:hypothetical protein
MIPSLASLVAALTTAKVIEAQPTRSISAQPRKTIAPVTDDQALALAITHLKLFAKADISDVADTFGLKAESQRNAEAEAGVLLASQTGSDTPTALEFSALRTQAVGTVRDAIAAGRLAIHRAFTPGYLSLLALAMQASCSQIAANLPANIVLAAKAASEATKAAAAKAAAKAAKGKSLQALNAKAKAKAA